MGWNGSGGGSTPVKPKAAAKKPSPVRGLVAGGVVVVLAVIAYFVFFSSSEKLQEKSDKGRGPIKEVAPAAPKAVKEEPKKSIDPREDYDHTKMYRDEQGILRWNTGCRAPDPTRKTLPPLIVDKLEPPRIFSNGCDIAISALLTRKPGSMSLAREDYYDPFLEEEFKQSLLEPIHINPNDSNHDKMLKQAIIDARKEIARRIGDGEKLGDILSETRAELDRLHHYKRELENHVSDIIEKSNGDLATTDVKDLIAAANKMFENEGLEPINDEDFVVWNLRLTAEQKGEDPDAAELEYQQLKAAKAAEEEGEKQ